MNRKLAVATIVVTLAWAWVSLAAAGEIGYTFKAAEKGFGIKAPPQPTSAAVAADAIIGRPLGLGTTLAGTGLFIATLPLTVPGGNTRTAARYLVVKPGGWTFVRPLGRSDDRFEDPGVFPK
jgi:hypothetical protein